MEWQADQVRRRPGGGACRAGLVQRMSMGFEQLEANARDTQIVLGQEGRYVCVHTSLQ